MSQKNQWNNKKSKWMMNIKVLIKGKCIHLNANIIKEERLQINVFTLFSETRAH